MVGITSLKARLARLRLGSEEPYNEYTKNTGDKRKKKNKLTRSDQKRGKKAIKKKKTAEEIEEDRYRKKGNFVSDTYVDDKGDMYAPKDQV